MPRQMPLDVAERLIRAVQKREVLYDTRSSGYKLRNNTELAWSGVSKEVGQDVNFCRTSWAQLRSTFNRILAQLKSRPSASTAGKGPKWYLYHQMLFLKDHVAHGSGSHTGSLALSQSEQPDSSHSQPRQAGPYEVLVVDVEPEMKSRQPAANRDMPVTMTTAESPSVEVGVGGSGGTSSLWQTDVLELEVEEHSEQMSEASTSVSSSPQEKIPASRERRRTGDDPVINAFLQLLEKKTEAVQQTIPTLASQLEESNEFLFLKGLVSYMQQMTERNKRIFISRTTSLCMELLDSQEGQQ